MDDHTSRLDQSKASPGAIVPSFVIPPPASAGRVILPASPTDISYWHLAWNHKLLLIAFLVLGALGGTAYVVLQTPLYRASAIVELVGFNQSFMNLNQVDPQAGTDTTTASASNIQTQSRILTSRSMLNRAADRMNLELVPMTPSPKTWFADWRARLPFGQDDPLEQAKNAVSMAAQTVSARGVGPTRLIEIHCESTSPQVAANFVNTLAEEHVAQNLAARSDITQQTSKWMESQLEEAKTRFKESGDKLRDFVRQSGLDFFPEQSTLEDTKLRRLQTDLASVQADRIAKQARWESAKNTPFDNLPDILNEPTLQNLKARITDLRREEAQLTTTLTPENFKVQRIQAQITELEQALEKEKSGTLRRVENDYQEALRREKLLSAAYNGQTRTVGGQADKASQYAALKRDAEMAQQVYSTLLHQSTQAALIALVPTSNIRIVDKAVPIDVPSSPQPMRDIPLGALMSGGLGYGLVWLLEKRRLNKRTQLFNAPGNTRTILGVPELGVIPSAANSPPKRISKVNAAGVEPGISTANRKGEELEFASWQKSSMLAESFRQALTSILRSKPNDHSSVYVVTSVGPGEGKTSLSANLAAAMAGIGQRVLLVDADLRRPRLHTLFGLEDGRGLSDLLTCSDPLARVAMEAFIRPTQVDGLQVMTHGMAEVETPALLFFSPKVQELITILRQRFDFILVDSGPVLLFPDARLWGKHADGVVLIVRAGMTTQEDAMSVCQRFAEDGVPVLGTILNDWTPRSGTANGYSYYSYDAYGRK